MRIKRCTLLRSFTFLAAGSLLGLYSLGALKGDPRVAVVVPGLATTADAWRPAPPSGPLDGTPVPNFGVVTPGCLYRSGQPGDRGFQWLARNGFRSIVSLRKEHGDDDDRLRALGLAYLYLPIADEHAPTDEQARTFLEYVRDPAHWPVLVHCQAGMGRAGTLAALARYAIDGWSMSDALHEARKYRTFGLRLYGEQRRWLNRWKDRFPPGQYHPSRSLPPWSPSPGSDLGSGRFPAGNRPSDQ
jgi:tyrosine-protein phosphatase SIW14